MISELTGPHLSTSQVARMLGVSQHWVGKLIDDGRLPAVFTPLGRLVPLAAVEQMLAERESAL